MNNSQSDANNLRKDVKAAAETAREGVGQAASEAAEHARRAAKDVSETAELTFDQLKEQVETLRADLAKLASSAGEAGYKYVGEHVGGAVSRAEVLTRERPAAALGLAASVGFILAYVLARRGD